MHLYLVVSKIFYTGTKIASLEGNLIIKAVLKHSEHARGRTYRMCVFYRSRPRAGKDRSTGSRERSGHVMEKRRGGGLDVGLH